VAILRRFLYLDALVHAVLGSMFALAPRFSAGSFLGLPVDPRNDPVFRLLGVTALVLALLLVLVAQRVEELWWWSWAFVVLMAGGALIATAHALFGLPDGAAAWPWWTIGGGSWVFTFGLLWGIARAGTEASPS
jgi:hypothetical protein